MRFTERERELAGLISALDAAARGRGTVVLVSGEAGIGKTSLLARFADLVDARARVFRGTCEDLLTPRPLGPFRDMTRAGGALSPSALDDRDTLIDSLLGEMGFVQRPAVLIVEDIHWADQASLDVLRFLVRRVPELPAMLVVSYREEHLPGDHPLLRVVASVATDSVLRLTLSGLSDASVADLAREAGFDPGPIVAAVGGNPLFLSEVLAAPAGELPVSVRDAVIARMATLPPDCRAAVEDLSVVTGEPGWALIGKLFADAAVLDHAEAAGILMPSYAGLHFRHEIARRAVEASLGRSRRMAVHRRVLAALRQLEAEPSQLVHHAMAAGDDPAIAEYAARAADAAARVNGHREVIRFAELALGHGELPASRRAELHALAARALYGSNRFGAAVRHADRAAAILQADGSDPVRLADVLLFSARIRTLLAQPATARAAANRAVALLEPLGPSPTLAFGYAMLGAQDTLQARYDDGLRWSDRALRMAEQTGADEVLAFSLNYRGVARASAGDEEGIADLHRSVEVAHRLRHADYETVAAHNVAVMHLRSGRVADAEPFLERAAAVAREHNLDNALFRVEGQQCLCLMLRGQWDEAQRRLQLQLADAEDAGAVAVNALCFLGRILARRGDPAAGELIGRASTLADATGEDQKISVAAGARVEYLWLTGDLARLPAEVQRFLPVLQRARHHFVRAEVLRYLQRAGGSVAGFAGCPPAFADGLRGDWAEAARLWEQAGNPYEQALELSESPDVTTVYRALELLDRLGATVAAARIRRRLRGAGVSGIPRGPRQSTRSNPALLTDRQRDVLTLLAQGLTNAEIAQRLVLSSRTVDNHVAAVLHRLGVASRRQVGAAAGRLGLLTPQALPAAPSVSGQHR